MAVTTTYIAVGEGVLYVGPSTGDPVADEAASADVGGTSGGVSISWEPTMVDIEVDQLGDAARIIQSRIKVMVKTAMAESTLQNLAYAWGYASGVGSASPGLRTGYVAGVSGTLNLGVHSVYPEERFIKVVASAPGSTATVVRRRTYKCDRAISATTVTAEHKRDAASLLEVEFRVLPTTTQTGAEYGTVTDS